MASDLIARDLALQARRAGRLRLRPVPRVGFLGDSLTQFAINAGPDLVQWTGVDYVNPLRWLLGDRLQTDRGLVFGVAGMGTGHFLATQVPRALAADLDLAFVQIGTNDIAGMPAEQAAANVGEGVRLLNAAGIAVVLIAVAPQDSWSPAYRQRCAEYNRRLYLLGLDRGRNVRFVDVNPAFVDHATGNAAAGNLFSDGVHDSPVGSLAKARRIVEAVDDLFPGGAEHLPLSDADRFDADAAPHGNLVPNPVMAGGGGTFDGGTGTLASNWRLSLSGGGVTVTAAKGVDPRWPGLATQVLALGGTGDGRPIRLDAGVPLPAGLGAGDRLFAQAEIAWQGLAAAVGAVTLRLEFYTPSMIRASHDGALFNPSGTAVMPVPPTFAGRFRTDPVAVPPGLAGIGLFVEIAPFAGAALAGSVTIGRVAMRRA